MPEMVDVKTLRKLMRSMMREAEQLVMESHRNRSLLADAVAEDVYIPLLQAEDALPQVEQLLQRYDQMRRSGMTDHAPNTRRLASAELQRAHRMVRRAVASARMLAARQGPEADSLTMFAQKAERYWPMRGENS
jgi:hypothetical protein